MTVNLKQRPATKQTWIALAAAATVGGRVVGCRLLGRDDFPHGRHPVAVYTVDDEPTASGGGHVLGICDADNYAAGFNGAEVCVVLNGPLGTVEAEGTRTGLVLDAVAVRKLLRLAYPGRPTLVVLEYQGAPVAVVPTAALDAGGPVTTRLKGGHRGGNLGS